MSSGCHCTVGDRDGFATLLDLGGAERVIYDREFERELESVAAIERCGSMREAMEQMRNAMAIGTLSLSKVASSLARCFGGDRIIDVIQSVMLDPFTLAVACLESGGLIDEAVAVPAYIRSNPSAEIASRFRSMMAFNDPRLAMDFLDRELYLESL